MINIFQRRVHNLLTSQPFLDLLISQGCLAKVSQDYVTREKVCQLCIVDNKRFSNFSESRKSKQKNAQILYSQLLKNYVKVLQEFMFYSCSNLENKHLCTVLSYTQNYRTPANKTYVIQQRHQSFDSKVLYWLGLNYRTSAISTCGYNTTLVVRGKGTIQGRVLIKVL